MVLSRNPKPKQLAYRNMAIGSHIYAETLKSDPLLCQNMEIRTKVMPERGNPIQSYVVTWQSDQS